MNTYRLKRAWINETAVLCRLESRLVQGDLRDGTNQEFKAIAFNVKTGFQTHSG